MRRELLFLDTFLSHESLRLKTDSVVLCLTRKNVSVFLMGAGGSFDFSLLTIWLFPVSWFSPHPFDFLSLLDFLLPIMFAYPFFFYPQNTTKLLVWWTHLLPPVQRVFLSLVSYSCLLPLIHCHPGLGIFPDIQVSSSVASSVKPRVNPFRGRPAGSVVSYIKYFTSKVDEAIHQGRCLWVFCTLTKISEI